MKNVPWLLVVAALCPAGSSLAQAQIFKCVQDGKVVYSDAPCNKAQIERAKAEAARDEADAARREIEAEYLRLKKDDEMRRSAADELAEQARQSRAIASPKIMPLALSTYTRAGYPKTFATWGDAGVARIMEHERRAALLVAQNPKCDVVELVGLSSRSRAPDNIVSYIDCKNGQRFVVSAEELARGRTTSEAERSTVSDGEAIVMCHEAARMRLKFPSSADFGIFSNATRRDPRTGAILVQADFEALNGFGAMIPQRARCVIAVGGEVSVSITAR